MRLLIKQAARAPWELYKTYYSGKSFSVAAQDTTPVAVRFKTDGTKMYILGQANNSIYQYSLATAWDISTASYSTLSIAVGTEDTGPSGFTFKSDGTKLYMCGSQNDLVYQYTLSTPWDISTATYDVVSFDPSGNVLDLAFKSDGTKMYLVFSTTGVSQFSLSGAWDLSTAVSDSVTFSVTSQVGIYSLGLNFSTDGTRMYVVGGASSTSIFQYRLSSAWDLSTALYAGVSVGLFVTDGVDFKSDGTKMYVGSHGTDVVYEYHV